MEQQQVNSQRKILVTSALPYANGEIHIGHLVEYLQTDFFVRFQKLMGHECYYVCGDDTHGTPIMVRARENGITPEALIAKSYEEHFKDFSDFEIEFDEYSSTNSDENRELCEEIYNKMKSKGHIDRRPIKQLYCNHDKMFLPDRFVKGTCPNCQSKDQYGDSCDVCGATYSTTDLKDAACAICSSEPVLKDSDHLFFKLNSFKEDLAQFLKDHTCPEVRNKMMEWFKEDLRDWDISRDDPYFGFAIPGENGKYFYVWVDAPMGYVSFCRRLSNKLQKPELFSEFWKSERSEVYHFIGKDIAYFHTLFWPALLTAGEYRLPTEVFVHGHLMLNGQKMSKSKGTMISARTYLDHLPPLYLRYYYAMKMNSGMDDLDLDLKDFSQRINAELVGKITNLASRGASMLNKNFDSKLSTMDPDGTKVFQLGIQTAQSVQECFSKRDFSKGMTLIRDLADETNRYFDEKAPWKLIKENPQATQQVLTSTLNIFKQIAIMLAPILPSYSKNVQKLFLRKTSFFWSDISQRLENQLIGTYEHLATRLDSAQVDQMLGDSMKKAAEAQAKRDALKQKNKNPQVSMQNSSAPQNIDNSGTITIDDFNKIDLRIAKIIEAEEIKEADKLLRIKAELANGETRQIIAGIKMAYKPEQIIGKSVLIVANLAPRKMKFGTSEGMILAGGDGASDLFFLEPDHLRSEMIKPGQKVK